MHCHTQITTYIKTHVFTQTQTHSIYHCKPFNIIRCTDVNKLNLNPIYTTPNLIYKIVQNGLFFDWRLLPDGIAQNVF